MCNNFLYLFHAFKKFHVYNNRNICINSQYRREKIRGLSFEDALSPVAYAMFAGASFKNIADIAKRLRFDFSIN